MADVLVGRESELAAFDAVLARLGSGRGQVVVVEGEAGLGKTRLCEAFAQAAEPAATVAWVTCWLPDAVPAFWPVRRLLAALGEKEPVPAAEVDPQAARIALFDAVADLLAARAATGSLVLVVDDLQWADELSLAFLRFLAPMLRGQPIAVVTAVRTGEADPDLLRHAEHLRLAGLDAGQLGELVAAVSGRPASPARVADLAARTGGNPLFARELVAAGDDAAVPTTVRAVLLRKCASLSADCRAVLEVAALLEEPAVDVIAQVLDRADVADLVDEARAAGVVTWLDQRRFQLAHPLLRAVLAEDLGVPARIRLHQRIGTTLERLADTGRDIELAALAHHFSAAAAAGSGERAVRYAVAAGDEAMRLLAYEQAARHYEHALTALDLAPGVADRALLHQLLGEALVAIGRQEEARAQFRRAADSARAAGAWEGVARAALAMGSGGGFEVTLFDDEQQQRLEEAIDHVDDGPLRARLVARLSVARSLTHAPDRRRPAAEQALDVARSSADPEALCDALAALCDAIAGPEDTETRIALATELVAVARGRNDTARELLGRRLLVVAHLEQGEVGAAAEQIERYAVAARRLRQPLFDWYVPLWRAMQHRMEGDPVAADAALEEAAAIGLVAGSGNAEMLVLTQRCFAAMNEGTLDESFLEALPRELMLHPWVVITRALAYTHLRPEEARASVDAIGPALSHLHRDSEYLPAVVQAALAVIELGGHPLAERLYDELLPHRHRWAIEGIGAYCHGSVERPLAGLAALLGRTDDAHAHLAAARVANARGGRGLVQLTERMAERIGGGSGAPPSREGSAPVRFRRTGAVWEIGRPDRIAHVKDSKGMADLAVLLSRPRRAVAALDLAAPGTPPAEGDTGPAIDAQARAAYQKRLRELEQEVDDATVAHDLGRAERAAAERDALVHHLTAAYGLGGRARRGGDPRERARTAVTARVREAIKRVAEADAELGEHLRRSVQTGTFCTYDPVTELRWEL